MTENCRHEHPLHRNGQTQTQRLPQALDPAFFRLDERSVEDLLDFAWHYAADLQYFSADNAATGNWQGFLEITRGKTLAELERMPNPEPHFALFLCFLRIFGYAQDRLNSLTQRHLEYYFEKILQIRRRAPQPDQVHLVFELAKNATEVLLKKGTALKAGKDDAGKPLFYELTEDTLLNRASVAHLRTIFYKNGKHHVAPVANSADGLGEQPAAQPFFWSAFGNESHPPAPVGFAVAGPILRLSGGERSVSVHLTVQSAVKDREDFFKKALAAMQVFVTGEKGWIGPLTATGAFAVKANKDNAPVWTIEFTLDGTLDAIVPFKAELHSGDFNTRNPVARFLFDAELAAPLMDELLKVSVANIQIETRVSQFRELELSNSEVPLEANKPFEPFGRINPRAGSFFTVTSEEVFSKPLKNIKLHLKWERAPSAGDGTYQADINVVSGNLRASDQTESLFPAGKLDPVISIPPTLPKLTAVLVEHYHMAARRQEPLRMTRRDVSDGTLMMARYSSVPFKATLSVERLLTPIRLFRLLPREGLRMFLRITGATNTSNPPSFIPKLRDFSIEYTAETPDETLAGGGDLFQLFSRQTVQYFQIGTFGQRETNGYLRQVTDRKGSGLPLLARPGGEGQLLAGLQKLAAGQSVTLFFQVQEGSANPDADPPPVQWSVLSGNHWHTLDDRHLLFDRTGGLIRSGVLRIIVPDFVSTDNTFLEPGFVWLRALAVSNSDSVCKVLNVHTQGVVAQFHDENNSANHLLAPLAPGSVSKLAVQDALVKKVNQPYPSFGGRPEEQNPGFYIRVAERLRHKQRAVSIWDFERLVLEQFPEVFQVKCISHCSPESEAAPGHVTLIVIPDFRHYTAGDPLQPRLPLHVLVEIQQWVNELRMPGVAAIHVQNPVYERLLLEFKAAFRKELNLEFGVHKKQLNADIVRLLSPWANTSGGAADFDGRYYRSALIYALEQIEYVDFLTDFNLYRLQPDGTRSEPLEEASATMARAILVPAAQHDIKNAYTDKQ